MNVDFKLADLFMDYMVFQTGKPLRFFGSSKIGIIIEVVFLGQSYQIQTNDKFFSLEIPAQPVISIPFDVIIKSDNTCTVIKNCLCGHVFVALGQSNIEFVVGQSTVTDYVEDERIRFYTVPKLPYEDAFLDFPEYYQYNPKWSLCNKESIPWVTCIGYLTALDLAKELNIPIGVISCNLGDTSILSWADPSIMETYQSAKQYFISYCNEIAKYDLPRAYQDKFKRQLPKLLRFYSEINQNVDAGMESRMAHELAYIVVPDPTLPMGEMHYNRPGGCFKTMLSTIFPYSVGSVVYYQGEQDHDKVDMYEDGIRAMIETLRKGFKESILPVFIIQIPGYSYEGSLEGNVARLRAIQQDAQDLQNKVYLVSAVDLGERDNVHPKNKSVLSKRLSNAMLEFLFDQENHTLSPRVSSVNRDEEDLILTISDNLFALFSKSGHFSGIQISTDGQTFQEHKFVSVDYGKIIMRHCPNVQIIKYAYEPFPILDIYSKNHLPLLPFYIKL